MILDLFRNERIEIKNQESRIMNDSVVGRGPLQEPAPALVEERIARRHQQQRDHRRRQQPPDDHPRKRSLELAPFADADRHRHEAEHRGERRHEDRPQARSSRELDRFAQRTVVAPPQRVGVIDEQDRVAHDDAREHDRSTLVSANLRSASRCRIVARATWNAASACFTCSRSSLSSILAIYWPRETRSPSRTYISSRRPAALGTTSTVASPMRLPTTISSCVTSARPGEVSSTVIGGRAPKPHLRSHLYRYASAQHRRL